MGEESIGLYIHISSLTPFFLSEQTIAAASNSSGNSNGRSQPESVLEFFLKDLVGPKVRHKKSFSLFDLRRQVLGVCVSR